MCQHSGQCVDLVTRTECDCEGTGYYGQYCEKSGIGVYFPLRIPSCAQKGVLFQRHFSRAMHTKRLSALVCPCELSLSDRTFRNLSISVEHILGISNLSCSQHLHYLVPRPPPCSLAVHVELWDGLMTISLVSLSHDAPHSLISELYWSLETRQAFFVMLFLIILPLSAECMKWHQLPL